MNLVRIFTVIGNIRKIYNIICNANLYLFESAQDGFMNYYCGEAVPALSPVGILPTVGTKGKMPSPHRKSQINSFPLHHDVGYFPAFQVGQVYERPAKNQYDIDCNLIFRSRDECIGRTIGGKSGNAIII